MNPTSFVCHDCVGYVSLSTHNGSTLWLTVAPHRVRAVPPACALARAGAGEMATIALHVKSVPALEHLS